MSCNLIQMAARFVTAVVVGLAPTLAQVRWQFHADGTDGQTSMTDTDVGSVRLTSGQFSVEQVKFGSTSAKMLASSYFSLDANVQADIIGTNDFCIEFFLYIPNSAYVATRVLLGNNATGDNAIGLALRADGKFVLGSRNTAYLSTVTSSVVADKWQHVAITRKGNVLTIWVDGVSVGSASAANWNITGNPYYIGWGYFPSTSTAYYSGGAYIDEFRFCIGTAVYDSAFTPPSQPFVLPAS